MSHARNVLKLTNVAKASLEELRLDYEDFLRQQGLGRWDRADARRQALIDRRPQRADDVALWARDAHEGNIGGRCGRCGRSGQSGQSGQSGPGGRDRQNGSQAFEDKKSTPSPPSTSSTQTGGATYPEIAANGALALIAVATALLDRQVSSQAATFENEGGLTERMYRTRRRKRRES